jgi:hypothetical protein
MAGVLGIAGTGPKATTLDIVDQIQKGFPVKALYRVLTGRRPIDVILGTELGARLVEQILGRLRYGSAA